VGWAARELRRAPTLCLQGNLDPAALMTDQATLVAEARRVVDSYAERPFIFNLGHGVSLETPPEAVACLVDYLKSLDR
jgi:uroporphyrinogen decarboxylase